MPFDSMPGLRISVIIPNYNRETLIGETISNLLEQTRPPDEIIVVDDGSTDNSAAVIRSFGDKIKFFQQANQGPGAARNAGLRAARGELIQFQDSDDLFSRNKLEVQARVLEQTGADIALGPWLKMRLDGRRAIPENHVLQQKMPPLGLDLPCWWLRGWSTVFQSLLFRRSFLDRVGFYRTDLLIGEDGELFFRALTSSPKLAFSDEALTIYRLHQTNKLTRNEGTSQARRILDWCRCLRLMMERAKACDLTLDGLTRAIMLAEVKKQLVYLRALPQPPPDLVDYLSTQMAILPAPWLSLVGLGMRLAEQVRRQTRGSRWMTAYQASPPNAKQRKLLRDLGLEIG